MSKPEDVDLEKLLDKAFKKWIKENPEKLKEMIKDGKGKTGKEAIEVIEKIIEKIPYAICSSCHKPLTIDQTQEGCCAHCGTVDPYTRIRKVTGTKTSTEDGNI